MDYQKEFSQQTQNLLNKNYPQHANISEQEFLTLLEPLKTHLQDIPALEIDLETGKLPFVIVIKNELIATETMMTSIEREGKNGIVKLYPHEPKDFQTIPSVTLPSTLAYLLIDIDRGKDSLNVTPENALITIKQNNRSPLTIDEGIALLTHYPEFLIKNNCFSLLASRNPTDKRVPAIWINATKSPNLGWCWNGNPHTWLGSASCSKRV